MRESHGCGKAFTREEWAQLPTSYVQRFEHLKGGADVVHQAVRCACGSDLVALEYEVVRATYGAPELVEAVEAREREIVRCRQTMQERQLRAFLPTVRRVA